jgi:hypothetical protein
MKIALPQLEGSNVLTGSRIGCFQTCPRKEFYSYGLGIRREVSAHYFRTGNAVHSGLDMRAKGHSQDEAIAAATSTYEQLPTWATTDEQKHEWAIEREIVARLLSGYFWYWEHDGVRPDLRVDQIIETEGPFEIAIRNPETGRASTSFNFAGKRDKIVKLGDGRLAVMEHKTTGDDIGVESDYWRRLRIDSQISGYMLAAKTQGHDVQTVLYDVIRKPTIAPKQIPLLDEQALKIVVDQATGERMLKSNIKKDGTPGAGHGEPYQAGNAEKGWILLTRVETPEEFGNRLTDDIAQRPEFYFARQEIPRLEADLDEFSTQLWQIQQQMRESYQKGRHFRNTSACIGKGRCEFLDLCHQGIDLSQGIPAGFRQVTTVHEELEA